jgi:hypothetical protein
LNWTGIDQSERNPWLSYEIDVHTVVCAFIQWVQSFPALVDDTIPKGSFQIVLGKDQEQEDIEYTAWERIRETAAFQASFQQVSLLQPRLSNPR